MTQGWENTSKNRRLTVWLDNIFLSKMFNGIQRILNLCIFFIFVPKDQIQPLEVDSISSMKFMIVIFLALRFDLFLIIYFSLRT